MTKKDPDIEILKDGKPVGDDNDPFTVLLAILAVWAIAFVMGIRLRHPLIQAILFIIAVAVSVWLYRANKKGR